VLQFVPVQIVCTTLCCVLTHYKVYQEGVWISRKLEAPPHGLGPFGWGCGWPWALQSF
jgi:hypothetical protein